MLFLAAIFLIEGLSLLRSMRSERMTSSLYINPNHNFAESAKQKKIMSASSVSSFQLELVCSTTKKSRQCTLSISEDISRATVSTIKKKIEEEYSIPACVQTLQYEKHIFSNDTNLATMKIRSGDAFHVSYLSEGDCKWINGVVKWFTQIKDCLSTEDSSSAEPISNQLESLLLFGFTEGFINSFAYSYLLPWKDSRKYTNRLYTVQSGGLQTITDVYTLLLKISWKDSHIFLRFLESGILSILWNMAETFELRRAIKSHNDGLGMCMKSLLRAPVEEGGAIVDISKPSASHVLADTIKNALGLLCK